MPKAWQRTRQTTHGNGTKAWQRPCGWNAEEASPSGSSSRTRRSSAPRGRTSGSRSAGRKTQASDAAFDAQESAYEAFLDEGEDQAAAAWVSDDDVFDGHYSDY